MAVNGSLLNQMIELPGNLPSLNYPGLDVTDDQGGNGSEKSENQPFLQYEILKVDVQITYLAVLFES